MVQQRLLNAGVIRGAGGPPVVLAPPETDGALIPTKRGAKGTMGQPSQNAGGAELASYNKFLQYLAI